MTPRRPEFDAYFAIDYSANRTPKRGKDSIWWSRAAWSEGRLIVSEARNPPTRDAALGELRERLRAAVANGESVLVGFDFPYGYPAGFAAALALSPPAWRATWDLVRARIQDQQDPGWNNRFEVAADINLRLGGQGPYWGCPTGLEIPGLSPRKAPLPHGLRERRHTETAARGAKATWQLFYNGSVGSQMLLGLPGLASLRFDPDLAPVSAVWPFETGPRLAARTPDEPRIVHAEIYPSLRPLAPDAGRVKDALQVEGLARHFAEEDRDGRLHLLFEAPARLPEAALRDVLMEEGWILGVP